MMRVLAIGAVLLFLASNAHAESWSCLSDVEGVEAFESGDMQRAPNYTENSGGGVRVQREHPDTYMFGQAKYIKRDENSGAICQYSNHVGWVVTYVIVGSKTTDELEGCKSKSCRSEPHWRSEWTNSAPDDKERMYVCVQNVDGLDKPSTACTFEGN